MRLFQAVAACALLAFAPATFAAPAKKAPAKKTAVKKAPARPAPKAKNKGAGATQIKAIEGQILTTTFNNGTFQVRFSNLRRALAWQDEGSGEGNHYILLDWDAGNVTKEDHPFQMNGRLADDEGKQIDDEAESDTYSLLPASHAKGTLVFTVPDTFKATKVIFRFGYDAGDPLRTFLPKGFESGDLGNVGPAGSPVNNGLYAITANIEAGATVKDDEPDEGNKFVVVSGTVESQMAAPNEVSFESAQLLTKDGQSFDAQDFLSGENGKVAPGGRRKFRVYFEVPSDAELSEVTFRTGYLSAVPVTLKF